MALHKERRRFPRRISTHVPVTRHTTTRVHCPSELIVIFSIAGAIHWMMALALIPEYASDTNTLCILYCTHLIQRRPQPQEIARQFNLDLIQNREISILHNLMWPRYVRGTGSLTLSSFRTSLMSHE